AQKEIRTCQQIRKLDLFEHWPGYPFIGVCDQHRHAECETELGKMRADCAIANDAERCSLKLAAHTRFGDTAGAVDKRGHGDVAPAIDHEANGHLGDRSDET